MIEQSRSQTQIHRIEGLAYYEYLEKFGMDLALDRIRTLIELFGDPHLTSRTILVGGTNGKGSVCYLLSSILGQAGYRCGLYLSPHVFSLNERVSIDGKRISLGEMNELFLEIRDISREKGIDVTQFEAITTLAFLHFHRNNTDINVLEVGLGGRFDATNVSRPELSIITNVSLDHTEHLGGTVEEIAREKLGILRKEGTAIIGQHPEASGYGHILRGGEKLTGRLLANGRDFSTNITREEGGCTDFDIDVLNERVSLAFGPGPLTGLQAPGPRFQARNATVAVLGASIIMDRDGRTLSGGEIRKIVSRSSLPARFSVLCEAPTIIMDCAHNPDGVRELALAIERLAEGKRKGGSEGRSKGRSYPPSKVNWICSFMSDKDIPGMLSEIFRVSTNVYMSRLSLARSAGAKRLVAIAGEEYEKVQLERRGRGMDNKRKKIKHFSVFVEPELAVDCALGATTDNDILVVAGSIYSLEVYAERLRYHFPEITLSPD